MDDKQFQCIRDMVNIVRVHGIKRLPALRTEMKKLAYNSEEIEGAIKYWAANVLMRAMDMPKEV